MLPKITSNANLVIILVFALFISAIGDDGGCPQPNGIEIGNKEIYSKMKITSFIVPQNKKS